MLKPLRWLAVPLALCCVIQPAQADGANGSIGLRGSMESVCYIIVNQTNTDSIDLENGVGNLAIAEVGEQCNAGNGFTVSILSANGGAMVNASGDRVPYLVRYDTSGETGLTSPLVLNRSRPQEALSTKKFNVKVHKNSEAVAGDYTDTITLSIAAR